MKSVNKTKKISLALLLFGILALAPAAMAATVSTDQEDYAPWELVTINGSGFEPFAPITLTIEWPDGFVDQFYGQFDENWDFIWTSTTCDPELYSGAADDQGSFYLMFGKIKYGGTYLVTATDGTTTAIATFTDTAYRVDVYTNPTTGTITVNEVPGSNKNYNNAEFFNYNDSKAYTITANPPASYIFSNWVVTGGVSVGNINLQTTTLTASSAGTLTANFNLGPAPIEITVTADPGQGKLFGTADPLPFTYSITSGDLEAGDEFTGALTRVLGEAVGSYAILQGTLDIDNSGSGKTYNLTFVSADFTITEAPIYVTVTVDPGQTKVYGTTDPLPFTFSATSGSLESGDSFIGALTRDSGENVGLYAILQGTLDIDNSGSGRTYILTFFSDDFTITAVDIEVTADPGQAKVYGQSDPTFTYTVTDGALVTGDSFTGALDRAAGEDVGLYAIGIGSLAIDDGNGGNNYNPTFVSNDFTITVADIEVTVDPGQTKVYGTVDPLLFTYSITSGALQFDDSFTGALDRVAGEDVGSYAIGIGSLAIDDGNGGNNYNLTFVSDDFAITQAHTSLTLTVSPQLLFIGDSINIQAVLSSSDSPSIVDGRTITFTIDPSAGGWPFDADTGIGGVINLSRSTAGWAADAYIITATYAGNSNIEGSSDDATVVVADPGAAATGGGFITNNGRENFGFTVKLEDETNMTYKGRFVIVNNGKWRMKGTLDTYGKTDDTTGYASGSGTLYQWDPIQIIWVEVGSDVPIMLAFTDTYNGSGTGNSKKTAVLDTFGVQIDYSSDDFEASNPNTDPESLKGGNIDIKSANNTTDGDAATPPPTGKGKNK